MTNKKRINNKQKLIAALPIAALLILFAVFLAVVNMNGYRLDMYLKIVFNEALVLAVVAT
jgi:ribose transport system permease protein